MAIEIVDLHSYNYKMVIFHSFVKLPGGTIFCGQKKDWP